jgi:polar amino acid transport system substrate-binding protein
LPGLSNRVIVRHLVEEAMQGVSKPAAKDIAPTGKLRIAIAISPAPGPFWAGRDPKTGEPRGVAIDLGRAMARDLGISADLVIFENSGAITDAASADAWDVTFVPMDAQRAKKLDFGPVYNVGESTFLVRAGAPVEKLEDVDKPGVKVVGVRDTTTIRAIGGWLKNTDVAGVANVESIMAQLKTGEADAFGMSRDALVDLSLTLPGSRVLPGFFFQAKTATAVPKDKPASLAFVTGFITRAKASGELRRIFDANGLGDQAVAP